MNPGGIRGTKRATSRAIGMVNGTSQRLGKTNGLDAAGLVNGTRPNLRLRQNRFGVVTRRDVRNAYVLLAVVIIAVPAVLFFLGPGPQAPRLTVDGDLADWEALGIPLYADRVDGASTATSLARYGMDVRSGHVSLAVEGPGTLFTDPDRLDGLYAFMDVDGDGSTGYLWGDLGADRMLRVTAGSGFLEGYNVYEWGGSDRGDWNGWQAVPADIIAALSGSALEVQATTDAYDLAADYRISLAIDDFDGTVVSSSIAFGPAFGAILVEQSALTPSVSGAAAEILELRLTAYGGPVTVDRFYFDVREPPGLAVTPPALPITVAPGAPVTVRASVDASSLAPGTAVKLAVTGVGADRPVSLRGDGAWAYAAAVPAGKRVDGLFADWSPAAIQADDPGETGASSDIVGWSSHADTADFFFYLRTAGTSLQGAVVPERVARAVGGGGGSQGASQVIAVPRKSGEDIVRVFIDEDPAVEAGVWVGGIFADYMIEAAGKGGRVLRTQAFSWGGPAGWQPLGGSPSFLVRNREGEGHYTLPVALPAAASVVIETTPWVGANDVTAPATTRGTRGDWKPRPTASTPPSWPSTWYFRASDPDEGLADTTIEILEVRANWDWGPYFYMRFVVEGSSPVLTDNSWWFYLDWSFGGGSNDWLVEETSSTVCSYEWDTTNSDWGTGGGGCDVTDSLTDSDVGSAVRTVSSCQGSNGCVDFALEVSDYPGFATRPYVTLAADPTEDLDLLGNTTRNPRDQGGGGCDANTGFAECVEPVEIPEFGTPLLAAAPLALLALRGRRRRRLSR
jgi:hypothetical protein